MSALAWCPCPDRETALALARQLVTEGLAACGNAIGPVHSVFAWKDGLDEAEECGLLVKTDAGLLDAAVARLEALHPYDEPAVLGWRCEAAGAATAAWLGALPGGWRRGARVIVRAALSALAIVLLVAGSAAAPATTMAAQARQFDPPAGPMKLTRVLERRLGDGKSVVVTRSWRVRFHRQGAGYLVDGEPLEVAVEVPPALEPLAEVERRNPQAGPFPIALDRQGRIVEGGPGAAGPVPGLTEAARAYVARRSPDRQAEAMDYVADVQRAGARMASRWPGDLFFPGPARERTAAVPVPGAEAGDVSVRFEGTLEPAGGHLASARRRIVTRVGGSERISLETWRLEVLD